MVITEGKMLAPRARPRRLYVLDTDVYWDEVGTGRPLLLLHGLSDSNRTWNRVVPHLAKTRRVLMPDLPGHGQSGRPEASYSVEWFARIFSTWTELLGLDSFDLLGHSFGGGVAQRMVLEIPKRIRRLGLVSSGGFGSDVAWPIRLGSLPLVGRLGQPFMRPGTRLGMRLLRGQFTPHDRAYLAAANGRPGTARALARTIRSSIGLRGQRIHFLDHANELRDNLPPTSVFWGSEDPIIPSHHALEIPKYLDGVRVTRFSDCGHYPHREAPEAFAKAVASFLDEPQPTPRLRPGWAQHRDSALSWGRRRRPLLAG